MVTAPFLTGSSHDLRLLLVEFRIQNRVDDLAALEHTAEQLRGLDRSRADENGLARPCALLRSP